MDPRPTQVESGAFGDWRAQLQRQRMVYNIIDTLKKNLPFYRYERLQELKKIAQWVEHETFSFTAATCQSEYSREICFMMLAMETKLQKRMRSNPVTLYNSVKPSTTKRKGWVNQGIKGPESIADHMYRMALMALLADDLPGINREECIKIALVHDIAEAIVGNITPSDGVPKVEKSRLEQAALNEMCEVLGGGKRAEEIKELWREYENNASLEANLVKDFDKIEMILKALEYETEHDRILDEFFLSTAGTNWGSPVGQPHPSLPKRPVLPKMMY
ncbi:putative HD/PDEase domain, coactivator CBP, KIX domain superfamily, 5'-deoxynucleotidase YfbR/HDDC2 [Helianthus debilis subsp. tardiflorus]